MEVKVKVSALWSIIKAMFLRNLKADKIAIFSLIFVSMIYWLTISISAPSSGVVDQNSLPQGVVVSILCNLQGSLLFIVF